MSTTKSTEKSKETPKQTEGKAAEKAAAKLDIPTNPEEQGEFNREHTPQVGSNEQEEAMLNNQMAPSPLEKEDSDVDPKKGEHPFVGGLKNGKIHIKHRITQDDFFLNPELRNFGFVEGELVELQVVGDSDHVKNSN